MKLAANTIFGFLLCFSMVDVSLAYSKSIVCCVDNMGGEVRSGMRVISPPGEYLLYDRIESEARVTHNHGGTITAQDSDNMTRPAQHLPWYPIEVFALAIDDSPLPFCEYCGAGSFVLKKNGVVEVSYAWGASQTMWCQDYQPGLK